MNIREGFTRARAVAKRLLPSSYIKEGRIPEPTGEVHCRGMRRAHRRRLYRLVVKAAKASG